MGAEKRHGVGEIDSLAATEIALDATSADDTHLRCGYFFTNLLMDLDSICSGTLHTVLPLDFPFAWVAPRDIAEIAAMALLNTSWQGRRVQAIHGPEDLTWNHIAAVLTNALNSPVAAEHVDDSSMLQNYFDMGLPPATANRLLGMSTGIRDDFTPEQPCTPQRPRWTNGYTRYLIWP